jgi:hypothetical protein
MLLIPSLVVSIIDIVIESLDPPILASCPASNILWYVLDILHTMIPLPLDVVWNVLDLLCLETSPVGNIFGSVFYILNTVIELVLDVVAARSSS